MKASQSTYASGDQSIKEVQSDKSTTIQFNDAEFEGYQFHDNYFGGEPYGGREVIFINNQPTWMMVYYGWVVENVEADNVYKILMSALRNSTIDMPYRGPELFEDGEWKYINSVEGEFTRFSGNEKILHNGEVVYEAKYMGGLVDKKVS